MKVTFLISDLSLARGGEHVTATIANALVKYEEVGIISLYQTNEHSFFDWDKSIKTSVIHHGKQSQNKIIKYFQKLKELLAVGQYIRKSEADFIVGVGTYCSVLLGMFSWLNKNVKYLAWEHANYAAPTKSWMKLRKLFYKKVAAIICLNHTDQSDFLKECNQVFTIPNSIGFTSSKKALLERKQVLSVGALEEEKGFDLLIDAFHRLENCGSWELLIIGEGSKKKELELMIQHHHLQNRITIMPNTKNIHDAYLNAGMYVLPSRREGFGMVLIEAMECGLPCIAFDCPTGPAHLIKNEINGLLVPAEDTVKLSRAIERLAQDKELVENLVTEAHFLLEPYREDVILSLWYRLFKELST